MLKFLSTLRDSKRERQQTDSDAYLTLLRKAATSGDLNGADTKRLDELTERLGKSVEIVEADLVAVRLELATTALATGLDAAERAYFAAQSAVTDHLLETLRLEEEERKRQIALRATRDAEQAQLKRTAAEAMSKRDAAVAARDRVKTLHQQHPVLFNKVDEVRKAAAASTAATETKRRNRHLRHATSDDVSGATYKVITFESLLSDPKAYGVPTDVEWVQMSHQSEAEFHDMVTVATEVMSGRLQLRALRYLRGPDRKGYRALVSPHGPPVLDWADMVREGPTGELHWQGGNFNPRGIRWVLFPGQTPADLASLVKQLTAAHAEFIKQAQLVG